MNFGVQPFSHSPPASGAGYVSVQEFARSNPSEQRKNCEDGVGLFLIRGAGCSATKLYKGLLAPDGKGEPRMCPSTMKFDAFNTYVADVKLSGGAFYYELQVLDGSHVVSLWSCEPFAKPDGTISLHLECGPCAHLICGDYEPSAESCNGRLIYYKRSGANMIIRCAARWAQRHWL